MKRAAMVLVTVLVWFPSLHPAAGRPDDKAAQRGELRLKAKAAARPGDVAFEVTLTNTSKDLLVNTWRHDRFDGVDFKVRDGNGESVKTRLFVPMSADISPEPNYIVLKPGEARTRTIHLSSVMPDNRVAPGRYKVRAVYRNRFQDEVYESKEVEVTVPAGK